MITTAASESLSRIRLAAFDVDGVFTDGRLYLSNDGVESKAFCTQDGFGVRQLLAAGIEVVVISGRGSRAVEMRMGELGVGHVVLNCKDKVAALQKIVGKLNINIADCLFVGDDVPDLPLLGKVGFSIAVANAVNVVRQQCDYTTRAGGGHGAVREVCDLVLEARNGNGE